LIVRRLLFLRSVTQKPRHFVEQARPRRLVLEDYSISRLS